MSSNDASSPSEPPGTTPTLNTLLSNKPMSATGSSDDSQHSTHSESQDSSQNGGTGDKARQAPGPPVEWPPQGYPQHQGAEPNNTGTSGPPTFPSTYPGQFMPPRPGMQGFPQYPGGYPPPNPGYQYPPGMMRPPPPDFVRMPPGTNPLEWSAMQKKMAESQQNPGTPAHAPAQSPASSSIADDSLDDKSRLDSPSWPVPPGQGQRTPVPGPGVGIPPGMGPPPTGMVMHGQAPMHPNMMPTAPSGPRKETIVDKLVGPTCAANPPRVMPERRMFFERLVAFCESHGEPITMVPQVSKQNVDLHRLYIAVRNRGGFEQVTKDKAWKSICQEANPEISESSAAGYQLRKHYQKYLLVMECVETGKNADDAVAFAEKLKRVRRKDGANAGANAQQSPAPAGPPGPGFTAGAPPPMGQMPGGPPQSYPGPPPGHPAAHSGDPQHYAQQPQQSQQMPPYYGYPSGPGGPPMGGYPPGHYPPRMAGAPVPVPHMQMRPPQPPQQMEGEVPQQPNTLQVPGQIMQPPTPGSQAGPASVQPATPQTAHLEAGGSQSGSRAPSAGPPPSAATPDSCSRLSAGGDPADRPESRTAATPGTLSSATPQPSSSIPSGPSAASGAGMMPPPHMQMPSTSLAASVQQTAPGAPMQGPGPFIGQPGPMYANGHTRPGPYPGYGPPPPGFHPGGPSGHPGAPSSSHPMHAQYQPHPNHPSHPAHPQHQQYMQQMWHSRGYPPPQGQGGPVMPNQMPRGYGYPPPPGPPRLGAPQPPPQGAPSPGANKMRYPGHPPSQTAQPSPAPQAPSHYPPTNTPTARPAGPPPVAQYPTPTQPSASAVPTAPSVSSTVPFPHSHSFPSGSIEATTISQFRRRRPYARDLNNATPRRLIMALRSGLETEAIWAMNALNVLLYDDSNPHPSLSQMPGLLNVLVEHFWATLSVLYPERFTLPQREKRSVAVDVPSKELLLNLLDSNERMEMTCLVTSRNDKKQTAKYSRTGRKVQFEDAPMPVHLQRMLADNDNEILGDESLSSSYVHERVSYGLGGGLAERVASRLRNDLDRQKLLPVPTFSAFQDVGIWDDVAEEDCAKEVKEEPADELNQEEDEIPKILLCRKASAVELIDGPNEWELPTPKSTALTERNEEYHRLAMRVLSLSNILRGFSFLAGTEMLLCKHHGLLYLLGRMLSLMADERRVRRNKPKPIDLNAPIPSLTEPESFHTERKRMLSILDKDDFLTLLLDQTAVQLRDDALTMLCHMSASLDLSEMPSEMAFPIYDGLLRWCVSSVPEATDILPSAQISLKNYCLEIVCKMVVIERNVDMLLSTGPFPRIEKFVKSLAKMLSMSEETQNREFAIVILNAFCTTSEAACYIASVDSPAITNLIAFIEASDQNMHQVMSSHGMPALRDNPEMMGTSVGMLRRAAALLRLLIKVPEAYKIYLKHQQRLLQFTMSQLMDSRVAGMIADTLYEMQDAAGPCIPDRPVLKFEPCSSIHNGGEKASKKEEAQEDENETTSNCSGDTTVENSVQELKMNGGTHSSKKAVKRQNFDDEVPSTKRSCLENGFGEKKNGKLDTPSIQKLKESSRQETSSMAVLA